MFSNYYAHPQYCSRPYYKSKGHLHIRCTQFISPHGKIVKSIAYMYTCTYTFYKKEITQYMHNANRANMHMQLIIKSFIIQCRKIHKCETHIKKKKKKKNLDTHTNRLGLKKKKKKKKKKANYLSAGYSNRLLERKDYSEYQLLIRNRVQL